MEYVSGVDIGATKTRVGLFTLDCELLYVKTIPTPQEGDDTAIARAVVSEIRRLASAAGGRIVSVGVGTVGPLDIRRGDVTGAPNVRARSFRLKAPIEEALGVTTYVVNDCAAAVWGEYLVGAGRGGRNVVYVTLSTGIGGGAVVDGHLLFGKDGNAHEVGHMVLDYSGKFTCGCGGLGHWEGIASGANIPRTANILANEWVGPETEAYRRALGGSLAPEVLFSYWASGDPFAERLVRFLAEVDAAGLASTVNVYDPEVLTVGGSVATKNPGFFELIVRGMGKYLINRAPRVLLTPLGDNAVLIGAAMIAIEPPPILARLQGDSANRAYNASPPVG